MTVTPPVNTANLTSYSNVCYLVYESVGEMKQSHHSAPSDPISKDAPGDSHEEVLRTVGLHLSDQPEKNKLTQLRVTTEIKNTNCTDIRLPLMINLVVD